LLYPAGVLTHSQIEQAVLNVARYDVFQLSGAVLGGQLARATRMLDGLQAEGTAEVLAHWALAEDIRNLHRARQALDEGQALPMVLKQLRIWGEKEAQFQRLLPRLPASACTRLLHAAHVVDGIVKGWPHPEWPRQPWQALHRLAMLMVQTFKAVQR
ncbi:MAG: DNA polymerase III subunit delta, partial [Comamonas sp.]|nr:DNA polymerase III subunit delta [Comamonas sp.]